MRLQDAVMASKPVKVQSKTGKIHILPGADSLAQRLSDTPVRYVLDDASAALVTNTAFASNNMLAQSLDLLRFPSASFWIEWDDRGRAELLRKLDIVDPHYDGYLKHRRAGALVRADDDGRRGEISILWESEDGMADLSPLTIHFDFGETGPDDAAPETEASYDVNIDSLPALGDLYKCARFRLSEPWRDYFNTYCRTKQEFDEAVSKSVVSIACDFVFITAFCLLLSVRGALDYKPNDLTRLNASRERKGVRPLLDYLTVSLDLDGGAESAHDAGGQESGPRASRRMHHVCGHLVRRQNSLFWRRAHLRGDPNAGVVSARNIMVTALRDGARRQI